MLSLQLVRERVNCLQLIVVQVEVDACLALEFVTGESRLKSLITATACYTIPTEVVLCLFSLTTLVFIVWK
jgi:hypothetical protein